MDNFLYGSMALTENHALKIIIHTLVDYLVIRMSNVNCESSNLPKVQHPAPFVFGIRYLNHNMQF